MMSIFLNGALIGMNLFHLNPKIIAKQMVTSFFVEVKFVTDWLVVCWSIDVGSFIVVYCVLKKVKRYLGFVEIEELLEIALKIT